jgi:hypothetical protein
MSQEHIELMRGVIEASERGEMEKAFAALDPEIEWHIGQVSMPIMDFKPCLPRP